MRRRRRRRRRRYTGGGTQEEVPVRSDGSEEPRRYCGREKKCKVAFGMKGHGFRDDGWVGCWGHGTYSMRGGRERGECV